MRRHRTHLLLDRDPCRLLRDRARATGRSLSDLVRDCLRKALGAEQASKKRRLEALERLWALGDALTRSVGTPADPSILDSVRAARVGRLTGGEG
ncbi:MAG: hypothetical protein QN134_10830 [Armatimonadota bacterium]|nr:hypothetical protein [Armatimonadota bacterium]